MSTASSRQCIANPATLRYGVTRGARRIPAPFDLQLTFDVGRNAMSDKDVFERRSKPGDFGREGRLWSTAVGTAHALMRLAASYSHARKACAGLVDVASIERTFEAAQNIGILKRLV